MSANVITVGGGPAGIITALTAKSVYPDISVCLIKEIGDGVIPCAIPYMMYTLPDPKQNAMGNMPLEKAGIDILVGKVVTFDPKAHTMTLESGQVLSGLTNICERTLRMYLQLVTAPSNGIFLPERQHRFGWLQPQQPKRATPEQIYTASGNAARIQ